MFISLHLCVCVRGEGGFHETMCFDFSLMRSHQVRALLPCRPQPWSAPHGPWPCSVCWLRVLEQQEPWFTVLILE